MSSSLGKSLQRTKRAKQLQNRQKYKSLIEAERDAALEAEQLRQCGTGRAEPLKSIWETNDLDNFLSIADAREEGYFAERNVRVVIDGKVHLIKDDKIVPEEHVESGARNWLELSAQLTIPRRPQWSYDMSAAAIQELEKKAFLDWRRSVKATEEQHNVLVTPYEKNLEVWRQLWRVVERADVVAMILDARNPLIFRSADFESYVRSVPNRLGQPKQLVFILNKADLLTETQRRVWAEYFQSRGETFFFFSARPRSKEDAAAEDPLHHSREGPIRAEDDEGETDESGDLAELAREVNAPPPPPLPPAKPVKSRRSGLKALRRPVEVGNAYELLDKRHARRGGNPGDGRGSSLPAIPPWTTEERSRDARLGVGAPPPPWAVRDAAGLLDEFARLRMEAGKAETETAEEKEGEGPPLLVGLVGYPNVGKSSTINALMGGRKAVVVSATPGKTKHFQTLAIPGERRVGLCDSPGLVFPSFASTRAQMVCDGVLPVDTTTDVEGAARVLCRRLPGEAVQAVLHLRGGPDAGSSQGTPHPDERRPLGGTDALEDRLEGGSRAAWLLGALARQRGFMAAHDRPDRARAGKELLKRYVAGELVYVEPPPTYRPNPAALALRPGGTPTTTTIPRENERGEPRAGANEGEGGEAEDWDSEDERAWADLDDSERSDPAGDGDGIAGEDAGGDIRALGMFLDRPPGYPHALTPYEYFNLETNLALATATKPEKRRKKPTNHQLEEDPYTFVNRHGEVELRIDDDDGVVEVVAASGAPRQPPVKEKSKRQQRREAKKMGAGPLNPFVRRVHIQDY